MRRSCRTYTPLLLLLPISALQIAPFYEPYAVLLSNNESVSAAAHRHELRKRDGNCPADFNSCTTYRDSAGGACCTAGSFCTTDGAQNIACCPTGASCTGSVTIATGTPTGPLLGLTTPADGVVFGASNPSPTTAAAGPPATITDPAAAAAAVSYVANAFFPFPYIPRTYANSAACHSAYQACQTNYAACTAALDGGGGSGVGFGVTIVAPNGGITATATVQNLGLPSATSICSSLSSVGCYNIVSENCAQFGTGPQLGPGATGNAAARQKPAAKGCYAVAGMVAVVGLGIAGQMI
ncbi:uncharacterized protein L3040_003225 [Drepanopeziza brunnea f. sp. 'multigermtubi']|uniref:Gpi-anchored protein n=1 Tax=Marssonina brunnea f. sp. multigermtubi (strain MB_m1) TaxID=1072389 RepID=K1X5J6_MARBU|nr:uncharacterized protein MBM_05929 [Drepanopeziza brunnea f. sp. 'multigermtubi' MB_m1]EKD15918.1 hypothetical protein MBM_05929 [Drepanopeziza brunnea f. sp. 'multigermtubi' MB_m1]KAJ5047398.1 hypothetical protein L3040_003225 [Drepanopeziza brunnea f. sp. 'multigermtubi']